MPTVTTDKDLQETIAGNVKRLRGERSFSEIAKACSTDDWTCYPATIQQVETCRHMPGTGLIVRLAAALGVSPNEILLASKPAAIRRRGAVATSTR